MSTNNSSGDLQASIADSFFRENGSKNSKMLVGGGRRSPRKPMRKKTNGGAK